jgi:hypothetical protein
VPERVLRQVLPLRVQVREPEQVQRVLPQRVLPQRVLPQRVRVQVQELQVLQVPRKAQAERTAVHKRGS